MEEITLPQSQQVEEAAAVTAPPTATEDATSNTSPAPSLATDVLRLRGLPFSATEAEVVEFFKGFQLKGPPLMCKRNGRASGECIVQLGGEDSIAAATAALESLNRKSMGHRYIEIFSSSEADLQTAKTTGQDRLKGFVVRLRGLPYTASAIDVIRFFNGVEIVRGIEGVVFTYAADGRPTGEAFVELQDEAGMNEAMKLHKETLGTRYIELFPSTKADLIQAIQHNRLILGSYRDRSMALPVQQQQQQYMQLCNGMVPVGRYHPQQQMQMAAHPHQIQYVSANAPRGLDEVTELFTGINFGGQNMQMIGAQQQGVGAYTQFVGQQSNGHRPPQAQQQQQRFVRHNNNAGNSSPVNNGKYMYTMQQQNGGTLRQPPHHQQQQQQRAHRPAGAGPKQPQAHGVYQMGLGGASAQNVMLQPQPYILQQPNMQYEALGMQEQYFGNQHMQQSYGHHMQPGSATANSQQYHMAAGQGGYTLAPELQQVALVPGELMLKQGDTSGIMLPHQ